MLTKIHIENFTIIDNLCVEFESGFNVLSGETGTGKSIWIDAISYALGARCDNRVILTNKDQCNIFVSFDISSNFAAQAWLSKHNFSSDGECVVRKSIHTKKASCSTINDKPCTQALIRSLAIHLLSIHGQHQHQTLLKPTIQQQYLDQYANNEKLLNELQRLCDDYNSLQKQIDLLQSQDDNHEETLSLLKFYHKEIVTLNLTKSEWDDLHQEHDKLHHAQTLISHLETSLNSLNDNPHTNAIDLLQKTQTELDQASQVDSQLKSCKEMIDTACINIQETIQELRHYLQNISLEPEVLQQLESRINKIHDLARKHQILPQEVYAYPAELDKQIFTLEHKAENITTLLQQQQQYLTLYQSLSKKLTDSRKTHATKIIQFVNKEMQQLGLKGGVFDIQFQHNPDSFHPLGKEKVVFYISTNPGQPVKPLAEIVSGGELSRLSLILHVFNASKQTTPTLIFDEVDTGIGGKTAEIVGQLLKRLGKQWQILCITHLHQVASLADHHYVASKKCSANKLTISIHLLNHDQRVKEIARMMGGARMLKETELHAKAILEES